MSTTISKRRNWDSEECWTKQDQNSVRKTPNPPATWSMLEHLHFYLLFLLLDLLPLPVYSTSWQLSPGTNTSSTLGAPHNIGFLSTALQDYLSGTPNHIPGLMGSGLSLIMEDRTTTLCFLHHSKARTTGTNPPAKNGAWSLQTLLAAFLCWFVLGAKYFLELFFSQVGSLTGWSLSPRTALSLFHADQASPWSSVSFRQTLAVLNIFLFKLYILDFFLVHWIFSF